MSCDMIIFTANSAVVVICNFSGRHRAAYPMNVSEPLPHTSTISDFFKSNLESRKPGVAEISFAGASRDLSAVLNGYSASASDRTSKVARITELSQMIQSRLRGPMQQLERHLECEHVLVPQDDHLSGKPGNVREFDSCQGSVGDFTKSQGNVR